MKFFLYFVGESPQDALNWLAYDSFYAAHEYAIAGRLNVYTVEMQVESHSLIIDWQHPSNRRA